MAVKSISGIKGGYAMWFSPVVAPAFHVIIIIIN